MLYDFVDALSSTTDCSLCASHCLQVNTPEAFVAAGEHKDCAVSHSLRHFGPISPALEVHQMADAEGLSKIRKSRSIRSFTDDATPQIRMGLSHRGDRLQNHFMAFRNQKISNDQNCRCLL